MNAGKGEKTDGGRKGNEYGSAETSAVGKKEGGAARRPEGNGGKRERIGGNRRELEGVHDNPVDPLSNSPLRIINSPTKWPTIPAVDRGSGIDAFHEPLFSVSTFHAVKGESSSRGRTTARERFTRLYVAYPHRPCSLLVLWFFFFDKTVFFPKCV